MGTYTDHLKSMFRKKDILIQIILINIAVFLILSLIGVFSTLFKVNAIELTHYLGVPSDMGILIKQPWSILTYMITHEDLWHILFNMLIFFWFGQIFLTQFSPKNLGSLYLLGGLAGAVIYIIAFNTVPYYIDLAADSAKGYSIMIGASASVMAVIFAAAFYRPNTEVRLFMLFRVKIIYIALFLFIVDFISLKSEANPGGHLAHIGGAIMGYIFARQYLKGKDITRWLNRLIDSIANLTKPRPKKNMKVKYKTREKDYDYNQRRNNDSVEIDRILDKIKASGYGSLSTDEKKRLFDASKK